MENIIEFIKFLGKSIISSDFYILLWAVITGISALMTCKSALKIKNELETSSEKYSNRLYRDNSPLTVNQIMEKEDIIQKIRKHQTRRYNFFINAVSVFPLWGMLGTVASLVRLSSGMSDSNIVMEQFFKALSSTAWGMIFAILFKAFIDPAITPVVSHNENDIELFLHRENIMREEAVKSETEV